MESRLLVVCGMVYVQCGQVKVICISLWGLFVVISVCELVRLCVLGAMVFLVIIGGNCKY